MKFNIQTISKQRFKASVGFTLIEMLLTISIFAIVGLGSVNILSSVTTSNQVSLDHAERMAELQRAMLTMERDFRQASTRKVRVNGEAPSSSYLTHGDRLLDSESEFIALRKVGWINPMNLLPRSEVQSFAYRIIDNTLERIHFDFPDPNVSEDFRIRPLLRDVKSVKYEFFNKQKKWSEEWKGKGLPPAIAVTLELEDMGKLRRIFLLPSEVITK